MINFNFIRCAPFREINDDVSDKVDVKHMEISGKFRVTSSRQAGDSIENGGGKDKNHPSRRGRPRTSNGEQLWSEGVVAISAVVRITLS